jgi:poly(hydroxyalkanoate) depolymerase family esterase
VAVAAVGVHCAPPAPLDGRVAPLVTTEHSGGYAYRLFVPSRYSPGTAAPLVLMLHGCTQSADQFAQSTQMEALAESEGFLVAFPDEPTSANPIKCWRWFETAHQARGSGEPAILAGIVEHVGKSYRIDGERVFVAGFSAGAGMAAVLGATYPDVFAAIAVGSGLEYKAATDGISASSAMSCGGPDPSAQGQAAFRAMGPRSRALPALIFHGTADGTVAPVNAEQGLSQWAQTADLADDGLDNGSVDDRADASQTLTVPGGRRYTRSTYNDRSGAPLLEKILVEGMNHAWSGEPSGSFTDPKGPSETALVWQFFRSHPRGGRPPVDGGTLDGGATDGGTLDGGTLDGGAIDAGRTDGGAIDAGTVDGGTADGGALDGGAGDAGGSDAGTRTLVLTSIDAEDGTVGSLPVDAPSASLLKLGDKGLFGGDQLRGVLSFDTSLLPAGAVVRSARLSLVRRALTGTVTSLSVDVQRGALGRSLALQADDYAAAATLVGVATFAPPSADDAAVEVTLPASALWALNPTGRTQLRLRAATPRDFATDALTLHDGAAGARAPRLVLTY